MKSTRKSLFFGFYLAFGLLLAPQPLNASIVPAATNQTVATVESSKILAETEKTAEAEKVFSPDTQITSPEEYAEKNAYCGALLAELFDKVYVQLDELLQDLALMVDNNQLSTQLKGDKKAAIKRILEYRQVIKMITDSRFVVVTQDQLVSMLILAQQIVKNLEDAVATSLNKFPPLNPRAAMTQRGKLLSATKQELENQANILIKKTIDLKKKGSRIGLNIANRLYRKLENSHNLKVVLKGAAIVTGVGLFALAVAHTATLGSYLPEAVKNFKKNWLGEPLEQNKMGFVEIPDNPGIVTTAHDFTRHFINWAPDPLNAGNWAVGGIGAFIVRHISPHVQKLWEKTKSKLRGGPEKPLPDGLLLKKPTTTLDDIIGNEDVKQELLLVAEYVCNNEYFDRAGIVPQNILCVGPTRTGKSFAIEALCGTINAMFATKGSSEQVAFFILTPSEIKSVGIKRLLEAAREHAPAVIFIDEIDLGGFQRERDADAVGEFLVAMSDINRDKSRRVIVIGATNAPQTLDIALRQPGRFGKELHFTYPTKEERLQFLYNELSKRATVMDEEFVAFLEKIAHETEGASYDGLSGTIITALLQAKTRQSPLEPMDIEMAVNQEIRQIQPALLSKMSESEQRVISAHLAGHIVASNVLYGKNIVTQAAICPRTPKKREELVLQKYDQKNDSPGINKKTKFRYGAIFTTKDFKVDVADHESLVKTAKIKLAGHIAETMILGSTSRSYHPQDEEKAFKIALQITFGTSNPDFERMSKETKQIKLKEAEALFARWKKEVSELLAQHKAELELLNKALFNHKIIPGHIVAEVIKDPTNEKLVGLLSKTQEELINELKAAHEQEQANKKSAK